jgi:hypothetical protein
MSFENVDGQKGDVFAVLLVKLVKSRNLLPERWSGVAPEDEHDWLFAVERSQLNFFSLVEFQ